MPIPGSHATLPRTAARRLGSALLLSLALAAPAAAQTPITVPPPPASPLSATSVRPLGALPLSATIQPRAQFVAQRRAVLAAPMGGRIVQLPWRDGDTVKEGELIARFDCAVEQSRLGKARATIAKASRQARAQKRLDELGSGSKTAVEVAEAEVAEAAGEARVYETLLNRCSVSAPFAGRVVDVPAKPFQFAAEGQPILELADPSTLEAEAIVPSRWLPWLKPGLSFAVAVDETGATVPVELVRVSGRVDPVSQSVTIYAKPKAPDAALLPGMSGRVLLEPPADPPPAATGPRP